MYTGQKLFSPYVGGSMRNMTKVPEVNKDDSIECDLLDASTSTIIDSGFLPADYNEKAAPPNPMNKMKRMLSLQVPPGFSPIVRSLQETLREGFASLERTMIAQQTKLNE